MVADWSPQTRPKFEVKTVIVGGRFGINLTVKEANRQKPIWKWVSRTGTKKHKIPKRPKTGRSRLRFKTGYKPKTRAGPARFGGPGVATGPIRYAKQVTHPGFKPRKFEEEILKDLRPDYNKAVSSGARRGLKRALGNR